MSKEDNNKQEEEDVVRENQMKKRVLKKQENQEVGDYLLVNEGTMDMDMDAWYIDVKEDGDLIEQIPQTRVMKQIHGMSQNQVKKLMRNNTEKVFEMGDAPEWVRGVHSMYDLAGDGFQISFEYLMGETALAKYMDENGVHEEWVITYGPDQAVLTAKKEYSDSFPDKDWETVGHASAVIGTEMTQMDWAENNPEVETKTFEDWNYVEEVEHLDDLADEEVVQESMSGVVCGMYDEGTEVELVVQRLGDSFRFKINDEAFYYWINDPVENPLSFRLPDWAIMMLQEDDYV